MFELLVALPRFCRQRTELGTCRPVITWKLPHQTWGIGRGKKRLSKDSIQSHPHPRPWRGPYCESRQQWLCELGLEGVQQLFGTGIVEGQETWVEGRGTEGQ